MLNMLNLINGGPVRDIQVSRNKDVCNSPSNGSAKTNQLSQEKKDQYGKLVKKKKKKGQFQGRVCRSSLDYLCAFL